MNVDAVCATLDAIRKAQCDGKAGYVYLEEAQRAPWSIRMPRLGGSRRQALPDLPFDGGASIPVVAVKIAALNGLGQMFG